jgi:diguanylate cyclase (GGDEF)-like protein/PAS domain S-box-containing protein
MPPLFRNSTEIIDQLKEQLASCRRVTSELRERYERLTDFVAAASDLLWETDAQLKLVSGLNSQSMETQEDGVSKQIRDKTVSEILELSSIDDSIKAAHIADLAARRPFRGFTISMSGPDGKLVWLETSGNPMFDKSGKFLGYRGTSKDVTQRKEDEARIAFMAHHDLLTNLPNRALLRERIGEEFVRTTRGGSFAVLCLDLDDFKVVNDTLGHSAGDRLLQAVATRLVSCARAIDMVARQGGDEFTIVQTELERPEDADKFAQRIVTTVSEPYDLDGSQVVIGVSVGVAVAPGDGSQSDQLLKNADIALYRAKSEDRGSFSFFEAGMDARLQARRALEAELRTAIRTGQFELFYQPLFDLHSEEITCLEALLRWHHPVRGIIAPADFIPIAEETGLIVSIGEWVLRQACAEAMRWPGHIRVAVNLSVAQFRGRKLVQAVTGALAESGLPGQRLELEITETVLMQNTEATLGILHQLRALDARISMDDFGTGYSSLSYLRSFPFDKVKIDRSFVHDLSGKENSIAVVRAILGLGHSLGLATTAEGVETKAQLAILQEEGCTEVQGYFFCQPKSVADLPSFFEQNDMKIAARKMAEE